MKICNKSIFIKEFTLQNSDDFRDEIQKHNYFTDFTGNEFDIFRTGTVYLLYAKLKKLFITSPHIIIANAFTIDFSPLSLQEKMFIVHAGKWNYGNAYNSMDIIINDIGVSKQLRNNGIGKIMANYILNKYKERHITLQAVDDGIWFWEKYGFESIPNTNSMMRLYNK